MDGERCVVWCYLERWKKSEVDFVNLYPKFCWEMCNWESDVLCLRILRWRGCFHGCGDNWQRVRGI